MSNMPSHHAIAAFIDILGYEPLVKKGISDVRVIQWLEGIVAGLQVWGQASLGSGINN